MKILLIFLSIQVCVAETAPVQNLDVWKTGDLYYTFKKDEETKSSFSQNCFKNKKRCEAYKAVLKKGKISLTEEDRTGGKNPGAVACKKAYSGSVLILRDASENESSFCKFKDNSIVSTNDIF